MKRILWLIALLFSVSLAQAQSPVKLGFPSSSANTNTITVSPDDPLPVTNSTLAPGSATAANQALEISALNTIINQAVPACSGTPVVSSASEGTHILKASAGSLCAVYAQNLTSTPGFLAILNSATVPADGAITPLACVQIPANGTASLNFGLGSNSIYSSGITAILTSAATCFTKTTGSLSGFIAGQVL